MKVLLFISLSGALVAAPAVPVKILAARTVVVSERSVIDIDIAPLQNTLIVLPANERVRNVFNGDAGNWSVEVPPGPPSRYLSIKVKTDDPVSTTVSVISDHEKSYSFRLLRNTVQGDSKVFIDADSQLAANLAKPADWVPRAEIETAKAASEKAQKEAETAAAEAKAKADTDAESFRATYPSTLRFDYKFDKKKARDFGVEGIFHDSKFTYVRAESQEPPIFYELRDGKPSLVAWDLRNGIYTVSRIVDNGYLTIGKQRLEFSREKN